ncbi:Major allergen d 1 [Quillaja saponaria]|uniref:Major allergen d 1 n=1 Tax=Quillaja saponaria TaxID=32244 RepID=A0AAD7QF13_QUISA|nr:Major allergen d 1 [Quillaja saponaria]
MGVFTDETEISSAIPPARLFKAFVLQADNLIPKILPHAISSIEIIEGDGGPGTIKKINFAQGNGYLKHKIDSVDKENLIDNYSLIGGDGLSEKLEKISFNIKFLASGEGTLVKRTSTFHTKGDSDIDIEEEIKGDKEKVTGLFKAVEAYLLANPNEYN